MRRPARIWRRLACGLLGGAMLMPWAVEAPARSLGSTTVRVVGFSVDVDTRPDVDGLQTTMTAVKDFPAAVRTVVGAPGLDRPPGLPPGAVVKAELAGAAYGDRVLTVSGPPNGLMELPTPPGPGDYRLFNVRLEDGAGRVILYRDPAAAPVIIEVIDKLLVTQVTSRPLSKEEIEEKGIVIDESNFSAVSFTVGLTLGSEQVEIELPVVLPSTPQALASVERPSFVRPVSIQRQFDKINIPNFSLVGFQLQAPPQLQESGGLTLPPINGVIVIPGNIGFLNQFFSVILQATNVAPEGSGLELRNARAEIRLPLGGDKLKGSGDDPLRVAETRDAGVQESLPLADAEGRDRIGPQATHQAEFLVEGLREGTHEVRFDITGDLYVPALEKTVPMTGDAAGLVQVKNPTFSIALAHPDVVREGEAYSIFATVTNTSTTPANLFHLALNTRSLSGARLAEGETDAKTLDKLAPGQAASFEYRMVARTTGEVTGTVFLADEGINGSFLLTTGVGDTGIPLSPDTLVLPRTVDYLPQDSDMLFQAVRLLGQAYSVATAPAGSLPPEVSRISKSFVFDRAVTLASTGLHMRFGDTGFGAATDILTDYVGADAARLQALAGNDEALRALLERDLAAFDGLRRAADAGHDFMASLGALIGQGLATRPLADLQAEWAERYASRPPHLSFAADSGGPALRLRLTDAEGRTLGRLTGDDASAREIAFADRLKLKPGEDDSAELLFAAAPEGGYTLEFVVEGTAQLELALVLPAADGGMMQAIYPLVELGPGARGRLEWSGPEQEAYGFALDHDGDGTAEATLAPAVVLPIEDRPPRVLGVRQWAKGNKPPLSPSFELGDPLGRMVGVLFDEEVTAETATEPSSYAVAENAVRQAALQPDGRLVFLMLEKPVGPVIPRELSVTGVADAADHRIDDVSLPIVADPDRGEGGAFFGRVVTAGGVPVPLAPVKYIQPLSYPSLQGGCLGAADVADYVVATYQADEQGRFAIDWVLGTDFGTPECPSSPDVWLNESNPASSYNFKLEATDPANGEIGKASSRIHFDGQRLAFDVIIHGFGRLEGRVLAEDGSPVPGGPPDTKEALWVQARNVSTGEAYATWLDGEGRYTFPREFTDAGGKVHQAPNVAVGNLLLHLVRPADGHTAVGSANLARAGETAEQDLLLVAPTRFGRVTGRLLEADGSTGAANVPVQIAGRVLTSLDLYSRQYASGVVASTVTDAAGQFSFEDVPTGAIHAKAFRQATYEEAEAKSVLAEGEAAALTLVFPGGGGSVLGLVRDAFGKPVPGAQVAGGPTMTEADENGVFEIVGLPLGTFTIYAQGKDSPAVGQIEVEVTGGDETPEVVITLQPLGSIAGTVYEADRETPVAGQKVQLWVGPSSGIIAEAFTDREGGFRFDDYPVADYSVRAVRADRGDGGMALTAIRFAGDIRDADIVFRGIGEIAGRVVQSNGTPAVSDVIVRHKAWRIIKDEGPPIQQALRQAVEEIKAKADPQTAAAIDRQMQETGAAAPSTEFFMLVDESRHVSSDELGPNGEVTGRFALRNVLAGPVTVAAFGPFLAPAEVRAEIPPTTDPAERRIDLGDVVLEPATGKLTGTVYLPDGETPVGEGVGVSVRSLDSSGSVMTASGAVEQPVLPEYSVVTGPDGRFEFPLVLRGRFVLTADTGVPDPAIAAKTASEIVTSSFADAEGRRRLNVRLHGLASGSVPAGETLDVAIPLQAAAGVAVQVLDATGAPVPQAEVTLATASTLDGDEEAGYARQIADEDGVIRFLPVIAGPLSVKARISGTPARGQAAAEVPAGAGDGREVAVTVRLGAITTAEGEVIAAVSFGSVSGRVLAADGTPLSNPAQVTVHAGGTRLLATTGEGGRFLVEDVPGGAVRVEAFEPFTARRGSAEGSIAADGEAIEVPVTLAGLGTVTGTVTSYDGSRRIAGADVVLRATGRFSDRLITRTDAQGGYALPGVPLGPYHLAATDHESGLTGEAVGAMREDGSTETTDVALAASGRIEGVVYAGGTVLDANGVPASGAEPIANAAVSIIGPKARREVQTGADGRFASGDSLPLGEYRVTVRAVGGNDGAIGAVEVAYEGETARLPMVLDGTGTVGGMLLDSQGVGPVASAQAVLESASPFSTGPMTRFTDENGAFRFEGVPVDDYTVQLTTTIGETTLAAAASGRLEHHGHQIDYGEADAAPLTLQPTGSATGLVLLPDGASPAEGAVVALRGKRLRLGRETGADGRFAFAAVPLGDYEIAVVQPALNAVATRRLQLVENGQAVDFGEVVLDGERPAILAQTPAADAFDVPPDAPVVVEFSEPLDPASVNTGTAEVRVDGKPVPASVALEADGTRLSLRPSAPLPDRKRVEVRLKADKPGFEGETLTPGLRDLAGLSLAADLRFAFTTGDVTPPRLVAASPASGAGEVDLSSVVRLEFSEPIDPDSIAAFTLSRDGTAVPGRMNQVPILDNRVFVFTPDASLQVNGDYVAELRGPVRDLAGNAMAERIVRIAFATADRLAPEIVALAPAAGATAVAGKAMPVEATLGGEADDVAAVEFYLEGVLAGRAEAPPYAAAVYLDPALGEVATVSAVAVDRVGNRSARASLPLSIAANRPPTVSILPLGRDEASIGETLTLTVAADDDVGLAELGYTANEGAAGSASRPLDSAVAEVEARFAVPIPEDLPVGSTLTLRAVARDQLGLAAASAPLTLGVVDRFPPAVVIGGLPEGGVDPGAELALIVTASDPSLVAEVSLGASGIVSFAQAHEVAPPAQQAERRFTLLVPADALPTSHLTLTARAVDMKGNAGTRAQEVPINDLAPPEVTLALRDDARGLEPGREAQVRVRASDAAGIAALTLSAPGLSAQSREADRAGEAQADFAVTLPAGTALGTALTLTATATDPSGNVGRAELPVTAVDLYGPEPSIDAPEAGTPVDSDSVIEIAVSARDPHGVARLDLSVGGATKAEDGVAFDPPRQEAAHRFAVTVPAEAAGGAKLHVMLRAADAAGNAREARRTLEVRDVVAPVVVATVPPADAVEVEIEKPIELRFSEVFNGRTATAETVALEGPDGPVPVTLLQHYYGLMLRVQPEAPLRKGQAYRLTVATGLTDGAGNAMAGPFVLTFTTEVEDLVGPRLVSLTPADGAEGVPLVDAVRAEFDEAIVESSVNHDSLQLLGPDEEPVGGRLSRSEDGKSLVFQPHYPLTFGTVYTARLSGTLTDKADNPVTDAEGRQFEAHLHHFLTASLELTAPAVDVRLPEGRPFQIAATAAEGLSLGSVVFEVDGRRHSPDREPPYAASARAPLLAARREIVLTAIGLDADGREIARDHRRQAIAPALRAEPALVGVVPGGAGTLRLSLSAALDGDLDIGLVSSDPSVAAVPPEVRLPAGATTLAVPVQGGAEGGAVIGVRSTRGELSAHVSVAPSEPGREITVVSRPAALAVRAPPPVMHLASRTVSLGLAPPPVSGSYRLASRPLGLAVRPAAFTGRLLLPGAGTRKVAIPVLAAPAEAALSLAVASAAPEILEVAASATIAAGRRDVMLELAAKGLGETTLAIRIGERLTVVPVTIGQPGAGDRGVSANGVGVAVSPPADDGRPRQLSALPVGLAVRPDSGTPPGPLHAPPVAIEVKP